MKVTIETTNDNSSVGALQEGGTHRKIEVTIPADDLGLDDVIAHVLYPLLLGWGFAEETISKSIGPR